MSFIQTSCATLVHFPTVQTYSAKPGLTPSASLVPGLCPYYLDLTSPAPLDLLVRSSRRTDPDSRFDLTKTCASSSAMALNLLSPCQVQVYSGRGSGQVRTKEESRGLDKRLVRPELVTTWIQRLRITSVDPLRRFQSRGEDRDRDRDGREQE